MIDRRKFLLGGAAAVLASCSSASRTAEIASLQPDSEEEGPYRLGAGDKVRITVFGEPTLSGEYTVAASGDLSFPLMGNVPAAGRTVVEVQESIRAGLSQGYIRDPRISIEIIDYRPFFVLGEVNRPGQYPYSIGLTAAQAIAAAGGFTYRANRRRIYIKRALETAERLVDGRRASSVRIRPGDTIRVAERFF